MLEGIIFDADGTLLDTMPLWEALGSEYLLTKGIAPRPDLGRILFPMTMEEAASYLKQHYPLAASVSEIAFEANQMIYGFYSRKAQPKPGVFQFLSSLKVRGVPMTVATSSDRPLIEAAFRRSGLSDYFLSIFTSTELGCGKDVPDIYLAAARRMGSAISATWVFEDALHAAETASRAGFPVVGVYDRASLSSQTALKQVSDYYIEDFNDFEAFIKLADDRVS